MHSSKQFVQLDEANSGGGTVLVQSILQRTEMRGGVLWRATVVLCLLPLPVPLCLHG